MFNSQVQYELGWLVYLSLEGQATEQEFQRLNELVTSSPDCFNYYLELIEIYQAVHTCDWRIEYENQYSMQALEELAVYEKTAPVIESAEEPDRELIRKVVYPPSEKRKLSKFNKFFLALNAAAVFFIVLFLKFAPSQPVEVATLSDNINAKWADIDSSMHTGTRLVDSREKLMLREGMAELTFDNGTQAVIEAPAEFQILADDRIGLNYGKVYATVPPDAVGFSVYTSNAKIIDMGTEFGVHADTFGNTQLSVLKGKILLVAGEGEKTKNEISEGVSKKISGDTGEISDIGYRSDYFVRDINSALNCIWKGQKKIDLADIIGGGNGLGTGTIDMGIHPISGKLSKTLDNDNGTTANEYRPVPSNPYIDGVFIPNGRTTQIVSSQGHIFRECPVSSGDWYVGLDNVKRRISKSPGSAYLPCIIQHANMGVTYDLQALRSLLPGVNIVRFETTLGIGTETDRPCNADFWILVDGELKYKKTQVREKWEFYTVDIELSLNDRFLTLITTDGLASEDQETDDNHNAIDSDWCRFVEPRLILE